MNLKVKKRYHKAPVLPEAKSLNINLRLVLSSESISLLSKYYNDKITQA